MKTKSLFIVYGTLYFIKGIVLQKLRPLPIFHATNGFHATRNHSDWLETNDNQMKPIKLCPVNMAGKVRLPNSCPVYIFLRVLLHVDKHCDAAKLVCQVVWRTLAAFFQCLVQVYQSSFVANSCDRFTRFQQLVVYHNWSHQIHSITFWAWILRFSIDGPGSPVTCGSTHAFCRLGFS